MSLSFLKSPRNNNKRFNGSTTIICYGRNNNNGSSFNGEEDDMILIQQPLANPKFVVPKLSVSSRGKHHNHPHAPVTDIFKSANLISRAFGFVIPQLRIKNSIKLGDFIRVINTDGEVSEDLVVGLLQLARKGKIACIPFGRIDSVTSLERNLAEKIWKEIKVEISYLDKYFVFDPEDCGLEVIFEVEVELEEDITLTGYNVELSALDQKKFEQMLVDKAQRQDLQEETTHTSVDPHEDERREAMKRAAETSALSKSHCLLDDNKGFLSL